MQYPSPDQPFAIKAMNRTGAALSHAFGFKGPRLEADILEKAARRKTKLDDFGDPDYRIHLDALLKSLEEEAHLSLIGRLGIANMISGHLRDRLNMVAYRKSRSEVAEQKIGRPIFVLGLPRTGTTILYELLAQDPAHRTPMTWEVARPFPPAQEGDFENDPRIAVVQKEMEQMEALAPGFSAIHEVGARLPQECLPILATHFASDQFSTLCRVPSYRDHLLATDMRGAYEWHRRFLQHLQVDYALPRWLLKTPPHLAHLQVIRETYPDAVFIQTHREPMEILGSISSLGCTAHGAFSDKIDPHEVALEEADYYARTLNVGQAQRDAMPDQATRFFDVQFTDFLEDPGGVAENIYGHFGFEFSDDLRARMTAYMKARPRDKRGTHSYTLEQFGITQERHGSLYAGYRERFMT